MNTTGIIATIVITAILIGFIAAAIISIVRKKKQGGCCSGCSGCTMNCGGCAKASNCEQYRKNNDGE